MEFWRQVTCAHATHTDPDEMGRALCAGCSSTVTVTLTRALLLDTLDTIQRDFGYGMQHSKRCVHTVDGDWVCADDCRMTR